MGHMQGEIMRAADGASAPLPGSDGLAEGILAGGLEGGWLVERGGRMIVARRAASCLLVPEAGDRVLTADTASGCFILAVLLRAADDAPAELAVAGADSLLVRAPRVTLRTDEARIDAGTLTAAGRRLTVLYDEAAATVGRLTAVVTLAHSVVDRLLQQARSITRTVEGVETVKATHLVLEATETVVVKGRQSFVGAEEDAVVRGKRVNLG